MQDEINAIIELQNLKDGYTPAIRELMDQISDLDTKIDKLLGGK